jgi:hypothetical protein
MLPPIRTGAYVNGLLGGLQGKLLRLSEESRLAWSRNMQIERRAGHIADRLANHIERQLKCG